MNQNAKALIIGVIGATITLSAYSQTFVSPTQCITVGLLVLMFGLVVREVLLFCVLVFWVLGEILISFQLRR